MTVRTREAERASTVFNRAFRHAFARPALIRRKFRDCAVVATVGRAGQTSKDLFLKNGSIALAKHFDLGLIDFTWLKQVYPCLGKRIH